MQRKRKSDRFGALLAVFALLATTLAVTLSAPAGALDCDSSDDRNSVQCSNHGKTRKGSSKANRYSARKGVKTTIDDRGGADRLTLTNVRLSEARFKTRGKDMVVSYRGGSVTIKNHHGQGRVEFMTFKGGDTLTFRPTKVTLSGPSAKKIATQAGRDKDRQEELERVARGGSAAHEAVFDISFLFGGKAPKIDFGLSVDGKRFSIPKAIAAVVNAIKDFVSKVFDGDSGGGRFRDDNRDGRPDYGDIRDTVNKDRPGDTGCSGCL